MFAIFAREMREQGTVNGGFKFMDLAATLEEAREKINGYFYPSYAVTYYQDFKVFALAEIEI